MRGLFGGIPYFASNQAAILYPINLLCYGLGPVRFWVVSAVLRLLLAGIGTYLLVRRLGADPRGAVMAGALVSVLALLGMLATALWPRRTARIRR